MRTRITMMAPIAASVVLAVFIVALMARRGSWSVMTFVEVAICVAAASSAIFLWTGTALTFGSLLVVAVLAPNDVILVPVAGLIPVLSLCQQPRRSVRVVYAALWLALANTWLIAVVDPGKAVESILLNLSLAVVALVLSESFAAIARSAAAEQARRLADFRLLIARELHDRVARELTHVVMRGEQLKLRGKVTLEDSNSMASGAQRSIHALREIMSLLRSSEDEPLMPSVPSLVRVIEAAQKQLASAGYSVSVSFLGEGDALPEAVEVTLTKVVSEAVTNIILHGKPGPCRLLFEVAADRVEFIATNRARFGRYMPAEGFGLCGMRERVESMGGTCSVTTASGRWVVHVVLPLGSAPPMEVGNG